MKTEQQVRIKFANYFLDLQGENAADGARVSKAHEWQTFIQHLIDEGEVPPEAIKWKCPRSLKDVLRKSQL